MFTRLIPRTKANYTFKDLLIAFLTTEKSDTYRNFVRSFFKSYFACDNLLLTPSGRSALYFLLKSLPHSKILVPAYTCNAVVQAAMLAGKQLVFGETEVNGFNMAPASVKSCIDSDTVLVLTHQFGIPCAINEMIAYAKEVGAYVVEDCAASLGSRYDGQLTGTFGDAAFFSFDSTKLVNVPLKGGLLIVRDKVIFERCSRCFDALTAPMPTARKVKYLSMGAVLVAIENAFLYKGFYDLKFKRKKKFTDEIASPVLNLGPFYRDRFMEWQAAILKTQLERLDGIIRKRQEIYKMYRSKLAILKKISLPPDDIKREWAPIRFPIRVKGDKIEYYFDAVDLGIDFAFSFTFIASPKNFAISHQVAASVLDLPFYDKLTLNDSQKVVDVLTDLEAS